MGASSATVTTSPGGGSIGSAGGGGRGASRGRRRRAAGEAAVHRAGRQRCIERRGVERRRRDVTAEVGIVERGGICEDVARGRAGQSAAAHGPGSAALSGQHALGNGDLLVLAGEVCGGRIFATTVPRPGARGELQTALVSVARVDGPVAAGFAAGDLVPLTVGRRASLRGEGDAATTDHGAREGDFRDAYRRAWSLAMPSTHEYRRSSRQRLRGQLSGSGLRGRPALASRLRLHPKESRSIPGLSNRWTGGSPPPSLR